MRHLRVLAFAAIVILLGAQTALCYQVVSGHPRLFFLASDLSDLRSKCSGYFAADYQRMRSYCDSHMSDSFPLGSAEYGQQLTAYSFVWLMSSDTAYAARAKAVAQDLVDRGAWQSLDSIEGLSHFFDWCYDYLTPEERLTFGSTLAEAAQWWLDDTNWTSTNNYHEKLSFLEGVIYPGIVLYGEGIDDALAWACCDTFQHHVFDTPYILCALDEIASDGAHFEGSYSFFRTYYRGRDALEAWATASDQNAWEVSSNLQNLGRYYVYEIAPKAWGNCGIYGMLGSRQGDTHTHSTAGVMFRATLYNVAKRYHDAVAQWMADELGRLGVGDPPDWGVWRIIVWRDTGLSAVPPASWPTSTCFMDIGTAYMRSGWDYSETSEDVYAVFRCEDFPSYHTHAHQNHFMIIRGNDLLAIDSGDYDSYGSSHNRNYFIRSIAHNTITVFDPNETTWGGYANDGGQKTPHEYESPIYCGDASEAGMYRGAIVAFEDTEDFTYVKGDATAAYASYKVSLFTREIIYLKPDVFIVFDHVTATSPSFTKKWLLHSINEPTIVGDVATITQGESRLFVRTLLPDPHTTSKVGGPGHEFEVNGVNYPPSGTPVADAGSWRLEVSPGTPSAEDYFLHVLYVADAGVGSMPEASLVEAGDMVGVEVGGHVVLFSRTGIAVDSVTYEFGG